MNQDYIRTARAKGLTERTVVVRHAFRNALIPMATIVAFDIGALIGGAVITERVFGWTGMGQLFVNGLDHVDPNPRDGVLPRHGWSGDLVQPDSGPCILRARPEDPGGLMTTTTTPLGTEPGQHEPGITDQESNIGLKEIEGLSQGQIVRRRFFRHRGALTAMIVLGIIIITAFTSVGVQFGEWKSGGWWLWNWAQITPVENGGRPTLSLWPLNWGDHPFGQDEVGRDIFALVMRGTQQSLQITVIVGLIATTIGTVIGSVTGFYRKWVDSVLMRFTDIVITIPVIVIGAVLGRTYGIQGAGVLGVILGLVLWTGMARLVRGEFLRCASASSWTRRESRGRATSGSCSGTSCRTRSGSSSSTRHC